MSDFLARLETFLDSRGQVKAITQLTADASTREYFRVVWNNATAIACVYPEPFVATEQTYLDVTRLFESNGLPVAEIFDFDEALGVIVQEDLGDILLRDVLVSASGAERNRLVDEAIGLIAGIQAATPSAYGSGSIASRLKFDVEKFLWELEFFREHYFGTLQKRPLSGQDGELLRREFVELSKELESRAVVLCHRDFHAANIMVDPKGRLRMIDHQDARIGAVSYDLVSLLLDRIEETPPADWLAEKRSFLIKERGGLGLADLDETEFAYEFRLQTIQRCLKAIGTFSFQSANRGKTYFLPYIRPLFAITLRAAENLNRFPTLRSIIKRQL